ncbi:MAG: response regulator [Cyclobacteriaceae bacterium]
MPEKRRIVLIDDDFTTNTLNKLIIEKSELVDEVVIFDRADQALEFFQSENDESNNSLTLLDINMPVMDGWDFLNEYDKLNGKMKRNKIILLTSSIDPADKTKAEEFKPVAEYRSKPLSMEMLKTLVDKYFTQSAG